ncbi:hypothetical protein, partial [Enterocloster bolteae]|uniref:hypothetical protein n=1 Tax=Enterocloster bolteae TaxID=208479 RepID=UPI002A8187C4
LKIFPPPAEQVVYFYCDTKKGYAKKAYPEHTVTSVSPPSPSALLRVSQLHILLWDAAIAAVSLL